MLLLAAEIMFITLGSFQCHVVIHQLSSKRHRSYKSGFFFFFLYEPRNEYFCYPPSPKTGSLTSGQMFSEKGPERNISGFAGHSVSVTATQLCHFSAEAAIDDT